MSTGGMGKFTGDISALVLRNMEDYLENGPNPYLGN
jgi:hypothetical protein